jgi:hypothetical protein
MIYDYNKDEIKNNLTIEQVIDFIAELGGEPNPQSEIILCKTICHGGDSHKLYYYDNTKLFKCYTGGCAAEGSDAFDIFELTRKVLSREQPKIENNREGIPIPRDWNLPEAIEYVAQFFGYSPIAKETNNFVSVETWKVLNNYDRISNINISTQEVELKKYDNVILKHFPILPIYPWMKEGIDFEVMKARGICFDPKNCGIVIPHYDINNNLIGIRERTLVLENEEKGKYRPAYLNKQLYNHPLSFNLYNINNSKKNISILKKAVVFESEKSCLQYASFYGLENDISTACCGSSLIQYQVWLLITLGVEEIIIGFDKQFQEKGDEEFKKLTKNLTNIYKKYGHLVKISFLFDKENLLDYKNSPTDKGKEIYEILFKNRINLYL